MSSQPGSGLEERTDAELVGAARGGDYAAFDALVVRHARRAFSVAYRVVGQAEDAEDLVQDAFVTALAKLDTFQPDRSFGAWFYRILVNRGIDLRRSRARRRTEEIPASSPVASPSPLEEIEAAELHRDVALALARLPDARRLVFQLYDLEGFSGPQVAEILAMPEGTARWHLHQARRALRDSLAHHSRSLP